MGSDKPPKMNIKLNSPKTDHFTVRGKTLADVKKALDARRKPIEWGLYDSTRNFKSSARVDGDGKVTEVSMTLNPVIEMPKWKEYGVATKPQKASWDKMYKALMVHEKGHHTVQQGCMDDLKAKIKKTKDLDGKKLNELIASLQKDCQKKQDAYDSRTGHGKSQGVVLDLSA